MCSDEVLLVLTRSFLDRRSRNEQRSSSSSSTVQEPVRRNTPSGKRYKLSFQERCLEAYRALEVSNDARSAVSQLEAAIDELKGRKTAPTADEHKVLKDVQTTLPLLYYRIICEIEGSSSNEKKNSTSSSSSSTSDVYSQLINMLERSIRYGSPESVVVTYNTMALIHASHNKMRTALEALGQALLSNPNHIGTLTHMSVLLLTIMERRDGDLIPYILEHYKHPMEYIQQVLNLDVTHLVSYYYVVKYHTLTLSSDLGLEMAQRALTVYHAYVKNGITGVGFFTGRPSRKNKKKHLTHVNTPRTPLSFLRTSYLERENEDEYALPEEVIPVCDIGGLLYGSMGISNLHIGQPLLALSMLDIAISLLPSGLYLYGNALYTSNFLLQVQGDDTLSGLTRQQVFARHCQYGLLHLAAHEQLPPLPLTTLDANKLTLRVGYVTSDLVDDHAVTKFAAALFPLKSDTSPDKEEVFVYDLATGGDTSMRSRFESEYLISHWKKIPAGARSADFATLVRSDGIDILVDLQGHTRGCRDLSVFGHRPAPVQVTYMGYPNTTGLLTMDYRLTDAYCDPPSARTDDYHTERLVRLAHGCFLCFTPPPHAPTLVGPPPFVKNGYFTYGCFNTVTKLNSLVLHTWSLLLTAVPNSRLVLKTIGLKDLFVKQRYLRAFTRFGISTDRITILPFAPDHEYMSAYNLVDVALDPFPYVGTTTTCESLYMGVPVVTLKGILL